MVFPHTPLVDAERTCWLSLFYNPVIAKGFPTPRRYNHELGIEIPLKMMAALNESTQAVEYGGGLLIKGLCSMLVPVKRRRDSIQWHLIRNADGKRIKYSDIRSRCPIRLSVDEFGHEDLEDTRAFLAWWKISESYVGTNQICYDKVVRSEASRASKHIKMTDLSFGIQNGNLGFFNVNFRIGQKDRPRHISMAGRLEVILGAAEEMHVYLYDVSCKRVWLVSGTEVLLYLVQLKHRKKPYMIQGRAVELAFAKLGYDGSAACKEALMEMASVPLFDNLKVDVEDFCVKDLVQQLWQRLEPLEGEPDEDGISLTMSVSSKLKGYEIMDLVMDKKIHTMEVVLGKTNGGWPDLIKASDAVVLFGSHLGELIKPASVTNRLCPPWVSLPESRDYLATTTRKLLQVFSGYNENGQIALPGLSVHKSTLLFEDCTHYLRGQCSCQRLQQIISKSRLSIKSVTPPGPCPDQACIIIGRALKVLKSPRSNLKQPLFCMPNSQILPLTPRSRSQTPSDCGDDESACPSQMTALDVTPTSSIVQDSNQNEETLSSSQSSTFGIMNTPRPYQDSMQITITGNSQSFSDFQLDVPSMKLPEHSWSGVNFEGSRRLRRMPNLKSREE
jgi:hypothetical protein